MLRKRSRHNRDAAWYFRAATAGIFAVILTVAIAAVTYVVVMTLADTITF